MLVRSGDDRDLPFIAEMSATRAAGARLSVASERGLHPIRHHQDPAARGARAHRAFAQVEFLVAEEGHQAVAYLVCVSHQGRWTIEDAGDRDPTGARWARCCR